MNNILQISGWLLLIGFNVVVDWFMITRLKKGVNHVVETIVRVAVGIVYAGLAFGVRAPDEHFQWVSIFMITSFWIFFELGLNKARGLEPLYVGTTAKSDIFFRRNFPLYLGLKIGAAVLMITSVVQLLKGN